MLNETIVDCTPLEGASLGSPRLVVHSPSVDRRRVASSST